MTQEQKSEMKATEPHLSPVNILELPNAKEGKSVRDWRKFKTEIKSCSECAKERHCEPEQGKCYWCWITWFGLTYFNWVNCPQCGIEWSKLVESGVCFDCEKKKSDYFLKKKENEDRMMKIFGSNRAQNYYTFQRFRVDDNNRDAYETLNDFNSQKDNVYLWGTAGTGKTHLGYSAAKKYAYAGRKVIISTPLRIVDLFRTKDEAEKENRFREFTEADLLLIDDLGVSKHTDFGLEILCEIINRRTLQMKNGLIVTSNLSLDALGAKNHDDRLSSRLAGLCRVIEMRGRDFRLDQTHFKAVEQNEVERGFKHD